MPGRHDGKDPKSPVPERIEQAAHLCVDMQQLFSKGGVWETPWMKRVLPTIVDICSRYPERTVFTRFITPENPEDRPGRWRNYFEQWKQATRQELPSGQLDLVPELARFTPPANIIDKPAYSAFAFSNLYSFLTAKSVNSLVVTGAETDVCVLATVLDAVDLGFRVVIVEDALCSSSDPGHDALMTMYRTRFHEQIELTTAEELFTIWNPR